MEQNKGGPRCKWLHATPILDLRIAFLLAYEVLISANDVILESENAHVPKDFQVTVSLGSKQLGTLSIKNPEQSVAVPLSKTITEDKIVVCCYSTVPLVDGSYSLGSVSIPQYIILNGGL